MVDFVLKAKGESKYITVSDLTVTLSWRSAVDLDLVAFYQNNQNEVGGIFSTSYFGGTHGTLDAFPFMQLSGDELESDGEEASEEELRVTQLDGVQQLYILALNQTDARQRRASSLSDYEITVQVSTSRGEVFEVPLNDPKEGPVALLCRIDNSNRVVGPQLINEGRVMSIEEFHRDIPGAIALNIDQKLILQSKESAVIASPPAGISVQARLKWTTAVDLDLYCFHLKSGSLEYGESGEPKGFLAKLFATKSEKPQVKRIYFGSRGSLQSAPFICLDHDAGIGDEGGENEENIEISRTDHLDALMFVANIYNKPDARFSSYDGSVVVRSGSQQVEAPLTSHDQGAWAWISLVDCRGDRLRVINVNEVSHHQPSYDDFYTLLHTHLSLI